MVSHINKIPVFVAAKQKNTSNIVNLMTQIFATFVLFGTDMMSKVVDRDIKYILPIWIIGLIIIYFFAQAVIIYIQIYTNESDTHQLYKEIGMLWVMIISYVINAIGSLLALLLLSYIAWVIELENDDIFHVLVSIGISVNILWLCMVSIQIDPMAIIATIRTQEP